MDTGAATAEEGLLEREHEMKQLEARIDAAIAGDGSIVAVEGEAGIGKSALLRYAIRHARNAGMCVLSTRGGELEQQFGYGIVRQLFAAPVAMSSEARERVMSGAAGLAAPVLSSVQNSTRSGTSDPGAVLHGLFWLSANLASEQPLLIVVDDAHWADAGSIAFLSYLAGRIDGLALLVLYASRIGEGSSQLLPAIADPGLVGTVLRPGVLSEHATRELIERLLGSASCQEFAHACRVATAGNPFLLQELLRALKGDGIAPDKQSCERVAQIAPDAISRSILARLARLGSAATQLAFATAVMGTSAELRHAAAVARLELDAAGDAVDALTTSCILHARRPLEFIHPVVRSTVYAAIPPAQCAASHKRAARQLAQDDAGDVALAPHLLVTEPSGDPWVVERLRAAAQEMLQRGAPDAACSYLERANHEPPPPSERLSVLFVLGSTQLMLSEPEAIDHLREVVNSASDAQTQAEAAQKLVWALGYANRMDEAIAMATQVLARVAGEDEELGLRLEGELAAVSQFAPPAFMKVALKRLARYEGKLRGETVSERRILAYLAFCAARRGKSQTATATAELARLALTGDGLLGEDVTGSPPFFFFAIWALVYADRLDEAERYLDLAIDEARARGSAAAFGVASGSRCQVLIKQGRFAEAEAEALSVLALFQTHAITRPTLLSCLLHAMAERSDPDAVRSFLVEHAIEGDLSDSAMAGTLLFSRGHVRLAAGDARAALHDFEQLLEYDELAGLDVPGRPARASQAIAHSQLGERAAARGLAQEELQRARVWGTPSALAFALRTAGLVDGGDSAIELLRESVAAVESSPARYEHARSLVELGAALRRAGHRREARQPLRQALDLADRCGANRTASRAREELLATGARPRRTALSGADALTPSERRIARLAADGLTNREVAQMLFITTRTVETHLGHIYGKLDVHSRRELPSALQ